MAQFWINIKPMKKYIYIVLILSGTTLAAQDNKPKAASTATVQPAEIPYPNAPEITFTETEHNFGSLKRGQPVMHKFEYKNTGKEDLIINTCKAGCDCTTAKCTKEPVRPGKTGFIEVHYDSTRVGKFGKEVIVHSNARKPVVILIIRGNVENPEVPVNNEAPTTKSPAVNKAE
jgi:hypothetical protein